MKKFFSKIRWTPFLFLVACAGIQRDCASCNAENYGADWLIVQYNYNGEPINCWKLSNKGVDNEAHSDGVFWVSNEGHLVHISGWYNRIQVQGSDYVGAAKEMGIELDHCSSGKYLQ